jgi:hypothetical protein
LDFYSSWAGAHRVGWSYLASSRWIAGLGSSWEFRFFNFILFAHGCLMGQMASETEQRQSGISKHLPRPNSQDSLGKDRADQWVRLHPACLGDKGVRLGFLDSWPNWLLEFKLTHYLFS